MSAETPLEREAELTAIAALVGDASARRGGLWFLEGPPGIGKSMLLEHAGRMARDAGLDVLRARGHELERAFGWSVVRSLLEDSADEELLSGPAAPARVVFGQDAAVAAPPDVFLILHALFWLTLRLADRKPLLMVVDDAHWADEPSLRFLVYLLGRLADQPVAVLVAARAGEGGLVEQLAGDPLARVGVLAPLGAAGVRALVRSRLPEASDGFCRRCFELTAGNPLQVRELLLAIKSRQGAGDEDALAAAAEEAARSLGRSVLRRLGALAPQAQALARAVAVLEDDAPLRVAAALAGLTEADALVAAEVLGRADVLRVGDPLGFTHPLVRAAIYGRLALAERDQTHRLAARLLADARAPEEQVSAHLLRTLPAADAGVVSTLRAAARRALAQGVPRSAVDYLERALREPPEDAERAGVLAELGRAEALAGRPEAVAHLEAAVALAPEPSGRAALRLELGRAQHHAGRLAEASAAFRHGLDEVGASSRELADDLEGAYLASAMHIPSRAADAHRRGEAILADVRPASRAGRELASTAMMMGVFRGRPRDELLALARLLDVAARASADDAADARTPRYVIGTLIWCDDFRGAADALSRTFDDARCRGSAGSFAMACQLRARQLVCTGPIAGAITDAREAVGVWRQGRQMYLHAAGYCLVGALLEADDADAAADALELCDRQPPVSPFFAAFWHASAGRIAAQRGDDAAALEAFLTAGRSLTGLRIVNPSVLPWRSEAGLAAQRLGCHGEARSLIAEELQLAERFGAPRTIAVAARAAALLEGGPAGVEGLRSAVAVLGGCGAHVEHARALVDLGAAIRRTGQPVQARGALREAVAVADAAGAWRLARRGREELRIAGGRARPAIAAPGGLTASEHRVAELAAAGHTNREIADALYLTVKSVEWHLGNTYRKLDIRGRGELAKRLT